MVDGKVPLIGCGGVHCTQDALAMLHAGAVAVQVDSYVWKDPLSFSRLAETVVAAQKDWAATQS